MRRKSRAFSTRLLSIALCCLSVAACDESQKSRDKGQDAASNQAKRMIDEDTALLKDLDRAGPELERRLLQSVKVDDGVVLVRDPVLGKVFSHVLPTSSPWVISCGSGLSIVFGTSVSGDGSSVGNDVELTLATGYINQDKCAILAPRLGKRLKTLLQGPLHSP